MKAPVMYRGMDPLNSLVDELLANPLQHRDVSRHLQQHVVPEFSFGALEKPVWQK